MLILGMFLLRRGAREINGPFRIVTDESFDDGHQRLIVLEGSFGLSFGHSKTTFSQGVIIPIVSHHGQELSMVFDFAGAHLLQRTECLDLTERRQRSLVDL